MLYCSRTLERADSKDTERPYGAAEVSLWLVMRSAAGQEGRPQQTQVQLLSVGL